MVWVLTRYEGDYDLILGVYSNRDKAVEAARKDYYSLARTGVEYEQEYCLYETDLDEEPETLEAERIFYGGPLRVGSI